MLRRRFTEGAQHPCAVLANFSKKPTLRQPHTIRPHLLDAFSGRVVALCLQHHHAIYIGKPPLPLRTRGGARGWARTRTAGGDDSLKPQLHLAGSCQTTLSCSEPVTLKAACLVGPASSQPDLSPSPPTSLTRSDPTSSQEALQELVTYPREDGTQCGLPMSDASFAVRETAGRGLVRGSIEDEAALCVTSP